MCPYQLHRHHATGPQIVVVNVRANHLEMFSLEHMSLCAVFITAGTTMRVIGCNNHLIVKPAVAMSLIWLCPAPIRSDINAQAAVKVTPIMEISKQTPRIIS